MKIRGEFHWEFLGDKKEENKRKGRQNEKEEQKIDRDLVS